MKWIKWLGLSALFFIGCDLNNFIDDLDKVTEPDWNPEFASPVVTGTFNLGDYINTISDSITVYQDNDGVVVFEFDGSEIESDRAEDMISIPEQTFLESISFDAIESTGLPVNIQLTKSLSYDRDVDTEENDELDSMVFKSGILGIDINGNFPVSGQIDVDFNSIEINGSTFSKTYTWQYTPGSSGPSISDQVDLSGAFVDFTKGGTAVNNFNFDITLTINYEGQPISPLNSVTVILTMNNPQFQAVYGKFAQRTFNTPAESVDLGLFEEVKALDFYLAEPEINMNFKSSFGLPVTVGINSLVGYNNDGQSIAFTGSIVDDPVSVASPTIDQIGSYVETDVSINSNNSNIADVLAFLPNRIDYEFQGSVDAGLPNSKHFVLDSSRVVGKYNIKLPLVGHVGEFSTDQVFDFGGLDQDVLESVKVILKTINGLPLTVGIELEFLDDFDNTLLTLFTGTNILNSGTLDGNGIVVSPTENVVEVSLNKEEIDKLKSSTKIKMLSTLFTGQMGTENVKIRMEDEVTVSLFIQAQIGF